MLYFKLNIQRFADGKLIIETEVDTKKLEKQLDQIEKETEKLQFKKAKLEIDETKAQNSLKKLENQLEVLDKKIEDFKITNPVDYEKQTAVYQELLNQRSEINGKTDEYLLKLNNIHHEQTLINGKIKQNATEIDNVKTQLNQIPLNVTGSLKSGFDKLYKSAKRLTMGILGIRAGYSLVRKMASSYLADNEKTAQRMTNLWTGLGVLMGNIIEGIVNMLKKAVTAILYFASVLTGVNYIAKANEAITKKQTKATAGLRKEQDKLNASFDEMEVLQEKSSSAGGGASGGGSLELFDVNELGKAKEVIEQLGTKLKPLCEIVKGIVNFAIEHPGAVIAILGGAKLISFLSKIIGVAGAGKAVGTGLAGIWGALTALMAIGTIYIGIKIKNESEEFGNDLEKIRKDGKKLHKEFLDAESDINNIIENSNVKRTSGLDLIRQQSHLLGILTKDTLKEALKTIKEISREAGQNIEKEIELYNQGEKNVATQKKIRNEIYEQYKYNLQVIDTLKSRGYKTEEIEKLNQKLVEEYKQMGGKIQDANGKLTLLKDNSKVTVELDLNTKKAEKKATFLSTLLEGPRALWSGIKSMFSAKGSIIYPKLAMGGIVNQPGRGIPYHGATIGERGAEAVLPLTDSQQMALLGEAIGKYITINANIVNTMNGRVISRELQKVQNDTNFTMNR